MKWIKTLAVLMMVAFASVALGADWEKGYYLDFGAQGDRPVDAFHKLEDEHDLIYTRLNYLKSANAQADTPANPNDGEVWLDNSNPPDYIVYRYINSTWVPLTTLDSEGIKSIFGTVNYAHFGTLIVDSLQSPGLIQDTVEAKEIYALGDTAFDIPFRAQAAPGDTTRNVASFASQGGTVGAYFDANGWIRGNASFANSNVGYSNIKRYSVDGFKFDESGIETFAPLEFDSFWSAPAHTTATEIQPFWNASAMSAVIQTTPSGLAGYSDYKKPLELTSATGGDFITYELWTVPQATYVFKIGAKANFAGDSAIITLDDNISSWVTTVTSTSWQDVEMEITTSAGSSGLSITLAIDQPNDVVQFVWPRLYRVDGQEPPLDYNPRPRGDKYAYNEMGNTVTDQTSCSNWEDMDEWNIASSNIWPTDRGAALYANDATIQHNGGQTWGEVFNSKTDASPYTFSAGGDLMYTVGLRLDVENIVDSGFWYSWAVEWRDYDTEELMYRQECDGCLVSALLSCFNPGTSEPDTYLYFTTPMVTPARDVYMVLYLRTWTGSNWMQRKGIRVWTYDLN